MALPVFFLFCSVNTVAMKTGINNGTVSASCCQQSRQCSALGVLRRRLEVLNAEMKQRRLSL